MMYHLSNAKSLLLNAGRRHLAASKAVQQQAMTFFVVNKPQSRQQQMMFMVARRGFALPPHIKLEMPNLSPTMEKVLKCLSYICDFYRGTLLNG